MKQIQALLFGLMVVVALGGCGNDQNKGAVAQAPLAGNPNPYPGNVPPGGVGQPGYPGAAPGGYPGGVAGGYPGGVPGGYPGGAPGGQFTGGAYYPAGTGTPYVGGYNSGCGSYCGYDGGSYGYGYGDYYDDYGYDDYGGDWDFNFDFYYQTQANNMRR